MRYLFLLLPAILLSSPIDSIAVNLIKKHEGFVSKPYKDNGHFSVGYGTNISYITEKEATYLLNSRLRRFHHRLAELSWYRELDTVRQTAILNMTYTVGYRGILKFKDMIHNLTHHNYESAVLAMIDSRWYRQTGNRSKELVYMMRSGQYKE